MKKTIALLLSVLLILGALAGCGAKPEEQTPQSQTNDTTDTETNPPAPSDTAPDEPASDVDSPDGSVIFEKDGVKVTTAGLDTDPTDAEVQPIIWVDIENTGDQDVYLGVADGVVNGFMSSVVLIDFYIEDGEYYGGSYEFDITVPANSSSRYALSYYKPSVPGVDMDTLSELQFSFTTAEDEYSYHNYVSEPVVIRTGETVEDVDLKEFGTVAIDDEKLTLVLGEQDYDDWFGPEFAIYAENKTDQWIGLFPESAEGDGVFCDYWYGSAYVAPGKKMAGKISFDDEMRELKGIENLTLNYLYCEADSYDELGSGNSVALDPITVTYPPQVWGEYENGGLSLDVKPKYNQLITVETPANDPDGILFTVSETASLEAGGYEGAGWLFSIGKVSEDRLHEMLCYDMSGEDVIAKDEDGSYYVNYHATDVRYERATVEEMLRDQDQWTMINEWAEDAINAFVEQNGLESVSYSNTPVDMYLARAAWMDGVNATLSTTEYGPVELKGVDGAPYAELVLSGWFWEADPEETPDGEYVVLNFPDEDTRLDFFFAPGGYVRVVMGDYESLYQAGFEDDNLRDVEIMQGWYYALAELAGIKPFDLSLEHYFGIWHEKIAGRAQVEISRSLAPGKVKVSAHWPDSASVMNTWEMTARLEDGKLVYENGEWEAVEYDESGEGWTMDSSWEESGWFALSGTELIWHDDHADHGGESTFVK